MGGFPLTWYPAVEQVVLGLLQHNMIVVKTINMIVVKAINLAYLEMWSTPSSASSRRTA